jgi:23S rRNA (adenine2030-N6)-methyltransferase
MLSYQHIYHAGNHADILKHEALMLMLIHLNEKRKPYTVFDTHAGSGRYDLSDERSEKTGEAQRGIMHLIEYADSDSRTIPAELSAYLSFIRTYTARGFYPGSPELERCTMRKDDQLILSELHPVEIDALRENCRKTQIQETTGPRVQIHFRNGFEALRALTPPKIKRGLVLTDPSYEDLSDYINAASSFCEVHRRWPAAILILWYPLLAYRRKEADTMKNSITASIKTSAEPCALLDVQLCVHTPDSHTETTRTAATGAAIPRLYGSGLFIVNVPWKFDEQIKTVLPYLADALGINGGGSWSVESV